MPLQVFDSVKGPRSSLALSGGRLLPRHVAGDILAFIIPSVIFVEWSFGGRVFLSEILLLCILPVLLATRVNWLFAPLPRQFIFLSLLWLTGQILTDIVLDTPFLDWSRGWSKIVFLLLNFTALYLLLSRRKTRLLIFAVGIAVGSIGKFYISPSIFAPDYPWKFGVGPALTLLMILSTQWRFFSRKPLLPEMILVVASGVNFFLGYRSLGAFCLLAALYSFYHQHIRASIAPVAPVLHVRTMVAALFVAVMGVFIIGEIYGYVAGEGWLGEDANKKYETQASGRWGLLLGGRSELFASSEAILDSPILGHGSWAKDPKYRTLMFEKMLTYDYEVGNEDDTDLIPTHSYIFGAWVEAGVAGAIFWLWVLLLSVKLLITMRQFNSSLRIFLGFVAFSLIWDILFSPIGAEGRVYAPYNIVLLMFGTTLVNETRSD